MSFIKIKDPRRREELIKDFIKTRKRIKDNFMARKVGESEYQSGLTKLFKPVTETQKATAKELTETQKATAKELTEAQKATAKELTEAQKATVEKITSELLPIKEILENISAIPYLTYPSPEMLTGEKEKEGEEGEEGEEGDIVTIGPIATAALKRLSIDHDKIFGLRYDGRFYNIGNKRVDFEGDDIKIGDKVYTGTPGFWDLIISKNPTDYTVNDYKKYEDLLKDTNAIYQDNDNTKTKPKSSKSSKWKNIIKPIWERIKKEKEAKKIRRP